MSFITSPARARALAEAVVSSLLASHTQAVADGMAQDDLFERLEAPLAEALALYESRIAPDLLTTTRFFDAAVLDLLIAPSHES